MIENKEPITRIQLGNILRKLSKQYNYKYYSSFECCNNCFTSGLPDGEDYVYLKYCNKGMNREPLESFKYSKRWWLVYGLKFETNEFFKILKTEIQKISSSIMEIPKDKTKCIIIIREI